ELAEIRRAGVPQRVVVGGQVEVREGERVLVERRVLLERRGGAGDLPRAGREGGRAVALAGVLDRERDRAIDARGLRDGLAVERGRERARPREGPLERVLAAELRVQRATAARGPRSARGA